MPAISAVVVAYRSADHLPDLLRVLRDQGVDEVVVVDNASPDASADAAATALPEARIVRLTSNRGYAAGANAGAAVATGDLLLLINPDVRLKPGAVDALRVAHHRHPRSVLGPVVRDVAGRVLPTRRSLPSLWSLAGEEVLLPERARPGRWPQRLWARWAGYDRDVDAPVLSGVCLLIPRAVWEATGPLDEGYFLYWEEVDWQLRAREKGYGCRLIPAAEIVHARSTSLGLHDPRRARLMGRSTRRFLKLWMPGARGYAGLVLMSTGQAARWLVWAVQAARGVGGASRRRAQHAAWLAGAWLPGAPEPAQQAARAAWWLVEPFGRGGVAQYARDVAHLLAGTVDTRIATTTGATDPPSSVQAQVWFPRVGPRPLDRALAALVGLVRARSRPRPGETAWIGLGFRPRWERFLVAMLKAAGCRVVATVHNRSPHEEPAAERLVVAAAAACDAVVVHTEEMLCWAEEAGLPVTRLPFPPPGLGHGAAAGVHTRASLGLTHQDVVVAVIGNIRPYKGVDVLLDALGRLPAESPIRVVIAGQSQGWDVAGAIAESRAAQRVRLIEGYLPDGELLDVLDLADVVALPYRSIDHSGAGALAAARGLPALVSDLPALRELFGPAGRYVKPGSVSALAAALEELPSVLDGMRAKARGAPAQAALAAAYGAFASGQGEAL